MKQNQEDNKLIGQALKIAKEIAREAGMYLLSKQSHSTVLSHKAPRDHLLDADLEAERLILQALQTAFPTFGLLSEEAGVAHPSTSYQWVVDPLDGSANFQHHSPQFALSLSLLERTLPMLSVMYLPVYDKLFTAVRGQGATCNDAPIHVSSTRLLEEAILHVSDFTKNGDRQENTRRLHYLSKIAYAVRSVRMLGTAVFDFAYVASGKADACVLYSTHPWDSAAGSLFIEEAGGKVVRCTDKHGASLCLYSNEHLYSSLLQLLTDAPTS